MPFPSGSLLPIRKIDKPASSFCNQQLTVKSRAAHPGDTVFLLKRDNLTFGWLKRPGLEPG